MEKRFIELFSELFCGGKTFAVQSNLLVKTFDNLAAKTKNVFKKY